MANESYAVVMPVYNEAESIERVLLGWIEALKDVTVKFVVVNDGSTDDSRAILETIATRFPQVTVITKKNSGHGQSCVAGYKRAIELGCDYIFQTDSDGQVDPRDFLRHYKLAWSNRFVLGYRPERGDGIARLVISRALSVVLFLETGIFIRDANVPFRFFQRAFLAAVIEYIPEDFYLANILLSLKAVQMSPKYAVAPISFKPRSGGKASVSGMLFLKRAVELVRQLKKAEL